MNNEEKINAYWTLFIICAVAWCFLFIALGAFRNNGGNLIFWSIACGLLSPSGIFYEDEEFKLDFPTLAALYIGLHTDRNN